MAADVRLATQDDAELLARIGAEGFYADPVLAWVFQDDATRMERLTVAFTGLVEGMLAGGVVHLADGASAAFWRDPAFDHGADQEDPDAEPPPFTEDELGRFQILLTAMAEHHPHDPAHWYLNVVSTLPSRQSQGLGHAVLQPVLAQADAEGMPCYLESTNPRNRTLYYRNGFEDRDEIPLDGGPSLIQMWREPMPR
jgi:GNAT superfamily N-acetyltransferase